MLSLKTSSFKTTTTTAEKFPIPQILKGKNPNTAASDAEAIELGEADEPIVQQKPLEEEPANRDDEQQQANEAEGEALIEEKSEATDLNGGQQ